MDDKLVEVITNNLGWTLATLVAVTAILASSVRSIVKSLARERTRREVAAYIAEGSMTPEQGEKLMGAGEESRGCN